MLSKNWLRQFRNPPARYRQQMFWIWNGDMSEGRITEMLEGFAQQGIGGGFANPRPGRITPYLSERWFELWEHAVREAKRLKLECHILDEDGYPSGPAGGLVVREEPGAVCQVMLPALHLRPPVKIDGELLAAYAYDAAEGKLTPLERGADLEAELTRGPVFTVARGWEPDPRHVDLYRPEVTQTFLRVTHEKYVPHSLGAFGKQTRYVYTEEPAMATRRTLPISDYLLAEFRKDHGYDLLDKVGLLFVHAPESLAVRFDYFETLNRLWCVNFVKACADWCEEHGLEFTGHFWEHEWPSPRGHPNSMASYRWMQVPGIDLLGFQFSYRDRTPRPARLDNRHLLLTLKEADSVACQLGKRRVSSENYGAGGYGMSIRDFKPLSDWAAAYGINLNVPHLTYESLAGRRKYDWPQTISDHAPWWPCYHVLADHDARLTFALCQGRQRNRVLLLHPTASGWLHYVPQACKLGDNVERSEALIRRLRESQADLIQALTEAHVDFDLGDEWLMAEFGSVRGRRLCVGKGRYELVILPPNMETVLESTLALLERFLKAGGKLLALGKPPAYVRGRPSDAPAGLALRRPGQWVACPNVVGLIQKVRAAVPPRATRADGSDLPADLVYRRAEMGRGRVLHFFANPWMDPIDTTLKLEGRGLLRLDTASGQVGVEATELVKGGQCLRLQLPPAGHALFISEKSRLPQPPPPAPRIWRRVRNAGIAVRRKSPNVLVLDYCDLEMDGLRWSSINTARAYCISWQRRDIRTDQQYGMVYQRVRGPEPEPGPSGGPAGGFAVQYRFLAEARDLSSLVLAVERPWLYQVEVNERPVSFSADSRWLDEEIRTAPLADVVLRGENTVRLTCDTVTDRHEIAPAYVLGDFSLRPAERGFIITDPVPMKLGDWRSQGLYFYPWSVCYRTRLRLPERADGLKVAIPRWEGSAVRVWLDGREVGVVIFPPYEVEVRSSIEPGVHELEAEVIGNMKNLMGPPFSDGSAGLWSWLDHPVRQPEGSRYRFFPCGLMAPFEVSAWRFTASPSGGAVKGSPRRRRAGRR